MDVVLLMKMKKMQLAFIMVTQLPRGKQTRRHEEEIFRELLSLIYSKRLKKNSSH